MNVLNYDDIKKEYELALKNVKTLNKSLSEIDKLKSETIHQLENEDKLSASDGYKFSRALKDIQNKRRIIKNQMTEQQIIRDKLKPFVDSYSMKMKEIEKVTDLGKKKYIKNFNDITNKLNSIKIL